MEYTPENNAAVAEILSDLNESGTPVCPVGGNTHQFIGAPGNNGAARLKLDALTGVVFHEPDDMVASFRAGTALAAIQSGLAAHKQRLDVDPAYPESTLGGCLAVAHFGPRAHGWGTFRDKILGMRFVLPDGRAIAVGGRVMKNVAGYDLGKLMIGCLGSLGIICEVIFRVNPIGDTEAAWVFAFDDFQSAWDAVTAIIASQLEPNALCLLDRNAATATVGVHCAGDYFVFAAVEGLADLVSYHGEALVESLGTAAAETFDADRCVEVWQRFPDAARCLEGTRVSLRFGLRASRIPDLLSRLQPPSGLIIYPGRGTGFLHLASNNDLDEIRRRCTEAGGFAAVYWTDLKLEASAVWGPPRDDFKIMSQLKKTHDPKGILNSGRFYGGI